jgi:uncharacterized membrane protein
MSQKPEKTKHETVKKKPGISLPNNNTSMVIRLVVASVIFAFSLIVSMPEFLSSSGSGCIHYIAILPYWVCNRGRSTCFAISDWTYAHKLC